MAAPEMKSPTGNLLLDALPADERERIRAKLITVAMSKDDVLSLQAESVRYVYFPITGLVSCRADTEGGETIEVHCVGREGIVEPAAILTSVAAVTSKVLIQGTAYRIEIDDLCTLIRELTELPRALLKYAYSLAVRLVQATKCARFHSMEQRFSLWLLMAQRSHGKVIPCTHQAIAEALGARRATITSILNKFVQTGCVQRQRGRLTITDRAQLQAAACDCLQLIVSALDVDLECEL